MKSLIEIAIELKKMNNGVTTVYNLIEIIYSRYSQVESFLIRMAFFIYVNPRRSRFKALLFN